MASETSAPPFRERRSCSAFVYSVRPASWGDSEPETEGILEGGVTGGCTAFVTTGRGPCVTLRCGRELAPSWGAPVEGELPVLEAPELGSVAFGSCGVSGTDKPS